MALEEESGIGFRGGGCHSLICGLGSNAEAGLTRGSWSLGDQLRGC